MNTFLQNTFDTTTTQNGAITHKSSLSACLDLFSMGVSSSSKDSLIASALKENPVLAIKTVLYLRDVRNGQGNKDIARAFHSVVNATLTKYPAFLQPLYQTYQTPTRGRFMERRLQPLRNKQ